jgi:hypothetical protein
MAKIYQQHHLPCIAALSVNVGAFAMIECKRRERSRKEPEKRVFSQINVLFPEEEKRKP